MPLGSLVEAASNIIGGFISKDANEDISEKNYQAQKEFAQMGVRWKAEDAKAAGIHPLYALGAQTHSYTPMALGDTLGPSFAAAGQNISRAMAATATQKEREAEVAFQRENQRIALQTANLNARREFEAHDQRLIGMRMDNEMKQIELQRMRSNLGQVGPPMPEVNPPLVRGPESGAVKLEPSKQTSRDPLVAGREASVGGGKPAMVPYRIGGNRFGWTIDVPSSEFGEGLEGGGPFAWGLGALGIGGHYLGRFKEWAHDARDSYYRGLSRIGGYPSVHPRARR